jgi:hypothetical protein
LFEHLIDLEPGEFVSDEKSTAQQLLEAKINTVHLLEQLGVVPDDQVADEAQRSAAQHAFATLTQNDNQTAQKLAVATLNAPPAVKHLVGMLTAYDWAFVEQAQELRGYTVAGIVEETKHPDARIRLKALEMLGKVTEVALFTERLEVKHVDMTDEELETALRAKLGRLLPGEYTKTLETTPLEAAKP